MSEHIDPKDETKTEPKTMWSYIDIPAKEILEDSRLSDEQREDAKLAIEMFGPDAYVRIHIPNRVGVAFGIQLISQKRHFESEMDA